jgi:hypothetical protein
LITFSTALLTPFPRYFDLSPSRSSTASWIPVEAPDGTAARKSPGRLGRISYGKDDDDNTVSLTLCCYNVDFDCDRTKTASSASPIILDALSQARRHTGGVTWE